MCSVAIHQPNYIPWLGYFYKIAISDIFVFLDDVQFSNHGMHDYHYIKTPNGPFRLKIPVNQTLGDNINVVKTKDELGWKEKHLKTVETNYKKARFFKDVFYDFAGVLSCRYPNIAIQNEEIIKFFCKKLGIQTQFIESSSLNIYSVQEERIIDICKSLKADVYFSGTGARAYQDEKSFFKNGITLRYSEFKPFSFPQLWNEFQANVTILDYLMNCGYNWEMVINNQKDGNREFYQH